MSYLVESTAPDLKAEAFVRGEDRRRLSIAEFRGSWVVVALGARRSDVLGLAKLEEAFAANGAIVLAATPAEHASVELSYAGEAVRFPILCGINEDRRLTVVLDPEGVVRYVGVRQSARETLATLETVLYEPLDERRAA